MPEIDVAAEQTGGSSLDQRHPFPMEVFQHFSKTELLDVLSLMHRILEADRRRDVERLAAELPKLLVATRRTASARENHRLVDGRPGRPSTETDTTYSLLAYLFTCLSRAHTKLNPSSIGRVPAGVATSLLSHRELTVLHWMKEGKTNWEIARILGVSERTVRFHVGSIFEKLDVTSRTQAVARAMHAGLVAS